ncbi:ferrochelatase [Micrococcales bacterium 31B]|nr:ferrochelatase [Micrococcales bacterium 31B]
MTSSPARPALVSPPVVPLSNAPHDAILLLSFGGPNRPEDVVPFLRNVTRGRGIPEERLVEVGQHYYGFGGKSPINELNLELLDNLRRASREAGVDLPWYWGNRNWDPYLIDVMRQMHADGHRKILVATTSAYAGYSSCCQYNADLEGVLSALAPEGLEFEIDRTRYLFNLPSFVEANARAVVAGVRELFPAQPSPAELAGFNLLFVTHSIPLTMNDSSGREGGAYERQHRAVAARVAALAGAELGFELPHELTYCSRSGPPTQPWLEPDVGDRIEALAAAGTTSVCVAPIGFMSDHMEVAYDLDTEAKAAATQAGIAFSRAATVGTDGGFIAGIVSALKERIDATATGAARDAVDSLPCGTDLPALSPCWPRSGCCGRDILASRPRTAASAQERH